MTSVSPQLAFFFPDSLSFFVFRFSPKSPAQEFNFYTFMFRYLSYYLYIFCYFLPGGFGPTVVNGTVYPSCFLKGVFYPISDYLLISTLLLCNASTLVLTAPPYIINPFILKEANS